MDPNYRASEEQWAVLEQVNDANDEDRDLLQDLADWAVLSCILELLARVEALEAAQQQPAPPAPAEGLAERVAKAMGPSSQASMDAGDLPYGSARAAIREVAAWLRSEPWIGRAAADRLEQEANQ
jgi:hypothetical protein